MAANNRPPNFLQASVSPSVILAQARIHPKRAAHEICGTSWRSLESTIRSAVNIQMSLSFPKTTRRNPFTIGHKTSRLARLFCKYQIEAQPSLTLSLTAQRLANRASVRETS